MRIAILSDIHANIHSLEQVVNFLKLENVNTIYCLGDIIGYGEQPNEVIDLIRKENIVSVLGNHERIFLSGSYPARYNLGYTKRVLSEDSLRYLKGLPETIFLSKHDALLSHTIPPESSVYYYSNSDFSVFENLKQKFFLIGHTHYPMFISHYQKKIINPGSVGQPRDGNKRPSLLVCDLDNECFAFIRISI